VPAEAAHSVHLAEHRQVFGTQRGSRAERLAEIAASGPAMLTAEDTAVANAWLRRYVRVYVRENQVTEVRFL
jgi:hypothetical protein